MTTEIVIRGGSWISLAGSCRSANRRRDSPSYRLFNRGFRVVKEKKKEKKIEYRVNRGGSWDYSAEFCRSAFRGRSLPSFRNDDRYGFRVIKENKDDN